MSQKLNKNFKNGSNFINFTTRNKPHEGQKKLSIFLQRLKIKISLSQLHKKIKNNFMQIKKITKNF